MTNTEEITKKIIEMMEEELKAFKEDSESKEWAEKNNLTIYAESMKKSMNQHLGSYAKLSILLAFINEK